MGRYGFVRNLTPEEAAEQLAIPVFHILTGLASPVFPGSTHSGPSPVVKIQIGGRPNYRLTDKQYVVSVNAAQWMNAVIPVLEDERWKVQAPLMKTALYNGRFNDQLALIGAALRASFVEAGY